MLPASVVLTIVPEYDQTLLQVTDTVPPVGGTFTPPGPGTYTYDVNFNEPFGEGSVQTSDLTLSGVPEAIVDERELPERGHDRTVHD
jgi:hypothetical protein